MNEVNISFAHISKNEFTTRSNVDVKDDTSIEIPTSSSTSKVLAKDIVDISEEGKTQSRADKETEELNTKRLQNVPKESPSENVNQSDQRMERLEEMIAELQEKITKLQQKLQKTARNNDKESIEAAKIIQTELTLLTANLMGLINQKLEMIESQEN